MADSRACWDNHNHRFIFFVNTMQLYQPVCLICFNLLQSLAVLDEKGNVDPLGAVIMLTFRLIVDWILLQVTASMKYIQTDTTSPTLYFVLNRSWL